MPRRARMVSRARAKLPTLQLNAPRALGCCCEPFALLLLWASADVSQTLSAERPPL
jgi:hypothetical protein